MKKEMWLTSLEKDEDRVQKFMGRMKKFGITVQGHFWMNDLRKMAWTGPRKEILDEKTAMWSIMGNSESFMKADIRYGLSMLALTVQAARGLSFPIVLLQNQEEFLDEDQLPTPLKGAEVFLSEKAGLEAKLVAMVHKPAKTVSAQYRLDNYAGQQIGQWFEVGPEAEKWSGGAMFAVSGENVEIAFHAVGPAGRLPSETVLNYALKGMELNLGDKKYIAWAAQNEIDQNTSYFVKVDGEPDSILFGPYSQKEQADVFVLHLK